MNVVKHKTLALAAFLVTFSALAVQANDNLRVAYDWKEIDFKYANAEERWMAIERFEFKPENVIPFGIEIYKQRLFVTLPRWREGVPASLAYLDLNGKWRLLFWVEEVGRADLN